MKTFAKQLTRGDLVENGTDKSIRQEIDRKRIINEKWREFHELLEKKREINRKMDFVKKEIEILKKTD